MLKRRGKKYKSALEKVGVSVSCSPKKALNLVKDLAFAKFDESVDVCFDLGIDPRHADQQLRGTVVLPNGTGKNVRVAVITSDSRIKEAEDAGADFSGSNDMIDQIVSGWMDFDLVLATPDMMGKIGAKLGRILGSKGLMPNPKSGTVSSDLAASIKEFKGGRVEYRNDKNGVIHLAIGRVSFDVESLQENFMVLYSLIEKNKPSKAKGIYMKSISISSTMGVGVWVDPVKQRWEV